METILIVIHLMIVIALVVVVLLQRSEGGALGIGGGGGGMMSARGAANALTKTTGILAAGFFITSLSLGILARYGSQPTDILDQLPSNQGQSTDGGSLLDQLGGLPSEDEGASGAATGDAGTAAPADNAAGGEGSDAAETGATDSPSLIPDASSGNASETATPAPAAPETQAPTNESPAAATGADNSLLLDQPEQSGEGEPASDKPEGEASDTEAGEIPANPGETAPNAADPAFVPPVEDQSAVEQVPEEPLSNEEPQN
ncbi:protein-export membrane protein [Fulvimarina pelagi HTCC2506]|uniref:Protein-export membrane protein SecG n=1 Tax=Fulvimarina pelagi HTCC2506 TaxID=314231 RepID=Q0FZ54_9HYPH|nr:protein-export membrane protein [Fulvimarina pelagi HTCC2506]